MVNYPALEALKADLFAKGLAPKSVHHVLADFRTFLRWLAKRKDVGTLPEFPTVKVPEHAPSIPSAAKQDTMMETIPWSKRGYFLVRGYMGLRDQEAARSMCQDYRLGPTPDDDELLIRGKGGRVRLLPVGADVAAWVREFRPVGPVVEAGQPLFHNPVTGGS